MTNHPCNHPLQIEQHILKSRETSNWLLTTYKQAVLRDPVDAVNDAHMLSTALRMRCLQSFTDFAPLGPNITASVLRQHADALHQLVKDDASVWTDNHGAPLTEAIDGIARQLREVAKRLTTPGSNAPATD